MQIGIIGLGRMGAGMARRLARGGVQVLCYDQSEAAAAALAGERGIECVESLPSLCARMEGERVIVLSLPAGSAVEDTIRSLVPLIATSDTLVDAGNSYYRDSMRRALALSQQGFRYVDAGVSGGVHGLEHGYCLMLGGTRQSIEIFQPFARLLAPDPERGWLHCGPSGAGHFAKMIHNGIEYGMLQAYGEGFELLKAAQFKLDLGKISHLWNQGSVVRSWLLELAESAFQQDPQLASIKGYVEDSGEGRWTVEEAIEKSVPVPVLMLSLFARFASRQEDSFSAKVIAALRNEFGGHAVKKG